MIHKPKWKARARRCKSFFPVQILQHPVSVIIFSNIYKKINARIIKGLLTKYRVNMNQWAWNGWTRPGAIIWWAPDTTCSWKHESKLFLTPLSKFYIYGLISLKEHFTSPTETNPQQVAVGRRKWKQHARLQGIDLSPMHACGDWHLIRLSSWVFLSWMIAQVIR